MFEFFLDFFRSIPAASLIPLFMIFLGIGDLSKISLSIWSGTFIILISTYYGVKHANKSYFNLAKIYKTSRFFFLRHIVFPGALPHIFAGIRVGASAALVIVLVSEMLVGSVNGLGQAIVIAHLNYEIPLMYSLIILVGIFGYLLNKILLSAEKSMIHWTK